VILVKDLGSPRVVFEADEDVLVDERGGGVLYERVDEP
jgi:hypothetical protein